VNSRWILVGLVLILGATIRVRAQTGETGIVDMTLLTTNGVPASVTVPSEPDGDATNKTNRTEITSKQLRMDTEKKIAYFDGDVLVNDPQFQLRANRLVVYLNPNGSGMSHAEAHEDVIIVQESEKRRAYAQKAVYSTADGKIVLTGAPRIETDKGSTAGEVITIFRNNNTVLVEGGTKTTIDLQLNPPAPAETNAPPSDPGDTNAPAKSESN
jgi:lipopolysaccharide export system protein LptA